MKEVWTAVMLFGGSMIDVRRKSVPVVYLAGASVGTVVVLLMSRTGYMDILLGMIPGGALLTVGKFSGCVGKADGIVLLLLGAMYGIRDGGELMMYSLLLAAVVSIFLIALKHAGRKDTIPFLPFLLAGFLLFQLRIFLIGGG